MADAMSVAQTVAERLAEDETLRGDLSDIGFGPLLDWATNRAIAVAQRLAETDAGADAAAGELTERLRALVRAAVETAQTGDLAGLQAAVADGQPAIDDPAGTGRTIAAIALGDDPDANAEAIAAALAAPPEPVPDAPAAGTGPAAPAEAAPADAGSADRNAAEVQPASAGVAADAEAPPPSDEPPADAVNPGAVVEPGPTATTRVGSKRAGRAREHGRRRAGA